MVELTKIILIFLPTLPPMNDPQKVEDRKEDSQEDEESDEDGKEVGDTRMDDLKIGVRSRGGPQNSFGAKSLSGM